MAKGKFNGTPGPGRKFVKGQSGNPGGRPKYAEISRAIRHILDLPPTEKFEPQTYAEKIAYAQICAAAAKGGRASAEFVSDRAEGKPLATIQGAIDLTGATLEIDVTKPSHTEEGVES